MNNKLDKNLEKEMILEPDVTCPECLHKAEHKATWGDYLIYSCPYCYANWKAYKSEEGNVRIIKRYFFG
jgi:hypothetical protein